MASKKGAQLTSRQLLPEQWPAGSVCTMQLEHGLAKSYPDHSGTIQHGGELL
ncbi:hypothetical protein [Rhizobium sp. 007]|uniref:hypothetical protein n=1 Tax=Rhizobium sp. 007 TaxID=2785056 RepID=UPI00188F32DA|nr:hypothetical protein [Rhizobium sp. 007]QPB24358.1 hypothetical protein ISN39_32935 [Rhizobium sp. 007]